jgi:hypothetical protein
VSQPYAQEGEACSDSYDAEITCDPDKKLYCGESETCVKMRSKKDGEACVDDVQCPYESMCLSGVCTKLLFTMAEGQPCGGSMLSTLLCKEKLVCSTLTGLCSSNTKAKNIGKACTTTADCGDGGVCVCDPDTGVDTCYQMPVSSKSLWKKYLSVLECADTFTEAQDLEECLEKLTDVLREFAPYEFDCSPASILTVIPASILLLIATLF